jgi:hypothetical protein
MPRPLIVLYYMSLTLACMFGITFCGSLFLLFTRCNTTANNRTCGISVDIVLLSAVTFTISGVITVFLDNFTLRYGRLKNNSLNPSIGVGSGFLIYLIFLWEAGILH